MDVKQFDLFQRAVQYAIDESKQHSGRFDMSDWMSFPKHDQVELDFSRPAVGPGSYLEGYGVVTNIQSCGTAACLAGAGIMLHGGYGFVLGRGDTSTNWVFGEDDQKITSIMNAAIKEFGLDEEKDVHIFGMVSEPLEEIVDEAREIAARHGHELEVIW